MAGWCLAFDSYKKNLNSDNGQATNGINKEWKKIGRRRRKLVPLFFFFFWGGLNNMQSNVFNTRLIYWDFGQIRLCPYNRNPFMEVPDRNRRRIFSLTGYNVAYPRSFAIRTNNFSRFPRVCYLTNSKILNQLPRSLFACNFFTWSFISRP